MLSHAECPACPDAEKCALRRPVNGREVCATYLTRALWPSPLETALRSLVNAGEIRGYDVRGNVVTLDADMTHLELRLAAMDATPAPALGQDLTRGFLVSADIPGGEGEARARRGAPTIRSSDFVSTRSYYERATRLLRSPRLKGQGRKVWALHVEGYSEREIAARLGFNRARVRRQIDTLRRLAGIAPRRP